MKLRFYLKLNIHKTPKHNPFKLKHKHKIGAIMTTQTNGNKGNGDTSAHYDNATIANARKYYALIDDNGRDKAKTIVDNLIKNGQLKDSESYVKAYRDEVARRERMTKRAAQEAERKQAEKDAQERARKAQDDAQAKKEGKYTIDPVIMPVIANLINSGCTRAVVGGALKAMCGFSKEQIENALNDLIPDRPKAGRGASNDDRFNEFCAQEKRTEAEMTTFILEQGSDNFTKFTPHLLKRGAFFNAIHDKYARV